MCVLIAALSKLDCSPGTWRIVWITFLKQSSCLIYSPIIEVSSQNTQQRANCCSKIVHQIGVTLQFRFNVKHWQTMTLENRGVAKRELKKELVNNRKYNSLSVDEVMAQQSTWVSEWDWSIIQLFTLFFLPLSHASVLFCVFVPGVWKRQTNRRDCLLLPVGWWSASLTSHYLALGYSDSCIYYSCISPSGFIFLIQCPLKQKTTLISTHFYTFTLKSFLRYYSITILGHCLYLCQDLPKNCKEKRKGFRQHKNGSVMSFIMWPLVFVLWMGAESPW